MLGTLIFEWDEGGKEAEAMLRGLYGFNNKIKVFKECPEGNMFYIKKLV